MDHRYMNPSLSRFRQFLVVLAEPPAPAEQGQRAFYHPPAGQHLELVAVQAVKGGAKTYHWGGAWWAPLLHTGFE